MRLFNENFSLPTFLRGREKFYVVFRKMNTELRNYLRRLASELRIGCCYVYAQRWGDAPYRHYFPVFGMKNMRFYVNQMRSRGFTVDVWRPKND